jgi:hypothetical protein
MTMKTLTYDTVPRVCDGHAVQQCTEECWKQALEEEVRRLRMAASIDGLDDSTVAVEVQTALLARVEAMRAHRNEIQDKWIRSMDALKAECAQAEADLEEEREYNSRMRRELQRARADRDELLKRIESLKTDAPVFATSDEGWAWLQTPEGIRRQQWVAQKVAAEGGTISLFHVGEPPQ